MWLHPKFPELSGPFTVGTIDVELPISELESPSPIDENDYGVDTVNYRVFYPCEKDSGSGFISWLPHPQRSYVDAYSRFLGLGQTLACWLSYLPNPLTSIKIHACENAAILKATTSNKRWPVMIFSHGLGGTRNAYSFLAGSLASYGMIVVAPEHRDGSTPISFIRSIASEDKKKQGEGGIREQKIDYIRLPHIPSPTIEATRNSQLKLRLWEIGLIHDSLLKINQGTLIKDLNSIPVLEKFKNMMDLDTPGKITFAGHSFGATTVTQLVKSTFYASRSSQTFAGYDPLFRPFPSSAIENQINAHTPIILLDVWCLPLKAKEVRWLWELPFPSYSNESSPGGSVLLAIESQAFFNWKEHLKTTKQLLSPDPSLPHHISYSKKDKSQWFRPYFYYAENSAHISQSDFGLLFPWVTKKMLGCEEPERLMRLQVRAILQFLRNQNIEVSPTSALDLVSDESNDTTSENATTDNDESILGCNKDIRGWKLINTDHDEST